MTITDTDHRAESQARIQLEGIREMVAALDEEKYAARYASQLSREECEPLLAQLDPGLLESIDPEDEDAVRELIADALYVGDIQTDDYDYDREAAEQAIQDDPLSVQVRSDWVTPGEKMEPYEYEILLCTGGPAVKMTGDLNDYNEPESAQILHQDWFVPWEPLFTNSEEEADMVTYAQQFYFHCE